MKKGKGDKEKMGEGEKRRQVEKRTRRQGEKEDMVTRGLGEKETR